MPIADNIYAINKDLSTSCKLIAVSKRKPSKAIIEAYKAGQRHFGENYIQELLEKKDACPSDIHWHFIGHLQRNKVKYIAPFIYLIHAVDSVKLLKEIDKEAAKNNRVISVLLQVHIAKEETKFGFDIGEITDLLLDNNELATLNNIEIKGIMAMATNTTNSDIVNQEFKQVKALYDSLNKVYPKITELSIGMSQDYKIAMQHGSTFVRLGTAIFGSRS